MFFLGNSPASEFYIPAFRNTLFHLHRQVGEYYLPMKMEQTECSETSAYTIQTPGKYPEENIQHTEHGKSLKSRILMTVISHVCGPFNWFVYGTYSELQG